jgi:hypothetical protein
MKPPAPPIIRSETAFTLTILAAWMLLHLYRGVVDDAKIYAMQGLFHLHPAHFQQDIFFRYGSQDRYTLFGALFAPVIALLGLEHAAWALWIISQVALAAAGWALARRLLERPQALLALGLLYGLELSYGAQGVFYVFEDFLTPRPLAEALVLWSIVAALENRQLRSMLLLLGALLIHPLMAAAGVGVVAGMRLTSRARRVARWRWIVALALLALVVLAGCWALGGRMDSGWLSQLAQNTPYLLPSEWAASDWARTAVPLIVLWMVMGLPPQGAHRRLAGAALAIALAGLGLTVLAEALRLTLLIQAQPWRSQWLAVVLATLSLPMLGEQLWRAGTAARAALLLLIATYLLHDLLYCVAIGVAAIWLARRACHESISPRASRIAFACATALLALAAAWDGLMRLYSIGRPYEVVSGPWLVEMARRLARDSALPALLLSGLWIYVFRSRHLHRGALVTALAGLVCLLLAPVTWTQWTQVNFTPQLYRAFQPWRERIAPQTEVLWLKDPLYAWMLLERPSYLSGAQLGAELFSRPAAVVIARRLAALRPFLSLEGLWGSRELAGGWRYEPQTLAELCAVADVRYIVTAQNLSASPLMAAPTGSWAARDGLQLYGCATRP